MTVNGEQAVLGQSAAREVVIGGAIASIFWLTTLLALLTLLVVNSMLIMTWNEPGAAGTRSLAVLGYDLLLVALVTVFALRREMRRRRLLLLLVMLPPAVLGAATVGESISRDLSTEVIHEG